MTNPFFWAFLAMFAFVAGNAIRGSPVVGTSGDFGFVVGVRARLIPACRSEEGRQVPRRVAMTRLWLWSFGVAHLLFGLAGLVFPRWFYGAVPPWPPLHVGQIQIAGVFDLTLAALFLGAAANPRRYLPVVVPAGVVAECGHALVRIAHVVAGDNPSADLVAPGLMLAFGLSLLALGVRLCRDRAPTAATVSAPGEPPFR